MGWRWIIDILSIGEGLVELSSTGSFDQASSFQKFYGGDALNTAVFASKLGCKVHFLTRFGRDPFVEGLKKILADAHIDTKYARSAPGGTGLYFVTVLDGGERAFLYYRSGSAASTLSPEDLKPQLIDETKIVYATGVSIAISKSARQTVLRAFQLARSKGRITVFDPNYRQPLWQNPDDALDAYNELLPFVDILLPSIPNDTEPIIGLGEPEQVIEYYWLKGVPLIVLKASSNGCYVGYKKTMEHFSAIDTHVVDTTGAGDAFNAGFLYGLSLQKPLSDCARLGLATSALKIQHRGALSGIPSIESVNAKLQEPRQLVVPEVVSV